MTEAARDYRRAGGMRPDQLGEFGLVGYQYVRVLEDRCLEIGPHRRGIEDGRNACTPGQLEHVRVDLQACLGLAHHDLRAPAQFRRDIPWFEMGAGTECDDN